MIYITSGETDDYTEGRHTKFFSPVDRHIIILEKLKRSVTFNGGVTRPVLDSRKTYRDTADNGYHRNSWTTRRQTRLSLSQRIGLRRP